MEALDKLEKKSSISAAWFGIIVLIISVAVSTGMNLTTLAENTRRIQVLETRADSAMSKDDASDMKRRLEKIEDKIDKLSARQNRDHN